MVENHNEALVHHQERVTKKPLLVAIVMSGLINSVFELIALDLHRHVLQQKDGRSADLFACVSHNGDPSALRAVALLESFPETRAVEVESELSCVGEMTSGNVTAYTKHWLAHELLQPVSRSWTLRSCAGTEKQRGLMFQYAKVSRAFGLATKHMRRVGTSYDVAVRIRTDAWFWRPFDIHHLHHALRARPSARLAGGEYLAIEANGHCQGTIGADGRIFDAAINATEPCYLLQVSDQFVVGSWRTHQRLWTNMTQLDLRELGLEAPCCEEFIVLTLAFRLGVRQPPDAEQEPTLPLVSSFSAAEKQRLWVSDFDWFKNDTMVLGSGCPATGKNQSHHAPKQPVHELCAPRRANGNPDPWLHKTHMIAAYTRLHQRQPGFQPLAPYTAPLFRLKQAAAWHAAHLPHTHRGIEDSLPRCGASLNRCSTSIAAANESIAVRTAAQTTQCEQTPCGACGHWMRDPTGHVCVPRDWRWRSS